MALFTSWKNLNEAKKTLERRLPNTQIIAQGGNLPKAKMIEQFGLRGAINDKAVRLLEPLGYLDFLKLQSSARFVLTDSGGIQEETTYLGIPCITLRDNTERPATVNEGSNVITGTDPVRVDLEATKILDGEGKKGSVPKYWDGHTAERITAILLDELV